MRTISAKLLIEEAEKMWYKTNIIIEESDIFTLQKNGKKVLFKNIDFWWNNSLWVRFANYKSLTYAMLSNWWIKTPKSIFIKKWDQKKMIHKKLETANIQFPVVVKPLKWEHWNGVSVNIINEEDLIKAIKLALKFYHTVIVQEYLLWDDYRLIVIGHKFIAAMKRIPAFVIWDGKHTLQEIIAKENANPLRWNQHTFPLTTIDINKELKKYIADQWLTLESIISKNKKIFLRKNANLSTWWISVDVTDDVHPEIKKMAEKASKILWLQVCGVDYLSQDITQALKKQTWWIIEVNHTPWLRWHHFPFIGKPRNVAKEILKLAFKK